MSTLPRLDFSSLAVFERLFLRVPVRMLRAGNNVFDVLFYDVESIPKACRDQLLRWSDPDGSLLVVHPGDGEQRLVVHHEHVAEFLASPEFKTLDALAVAGVGSSALGTAALAANVADALGRPVLGIVSGYGLADVMEEGLAGWFVLRPYNELRQWIDLVLAPTLPFWRTLSADTQPNHDPQRLVSYLLGLPEVDTLDAVLAAKPDTPIKLLVGHSKGNLSIAASLAGSPDSLARRLTAVTFGALVHLPAALAGTKQFIGGLDAFGLLNSILPEPARWVPWAMHTLNPNQPLPMPAQAILKATLGDAGDPVAEPRADAGAARSAWAHAAMAPVNAGHNLLCAWQQAAEALSGALQESTRTVLQGVAISMGSRGH